MHDLLPTEVRQQVLNEHRELRRSLTELLGLVRSSAPVKLIRARAEVFFKMVVAHTRMEDRLLLPVMREADMWGEDRADELRRHHEWQRHYIETVAASLRKSDRMRLSHQLQALGTALVADMEREETEFLGDSLLRDDVTSVDMEAG